MVSDLANPLHGAFLGALEDGLRAEGYLLLAAGTHNDPARETSLLTAFHRRQVDGLVVTLGDEAAAEPLEALARTRAATVLYDRDPAGPDGPPLRTPCWSITAVVRWPPRACCSRWPTAASPC